jgi:hypothetical protein
LAGAGSCNHNLRKVTRCLVLTDCRDLTHAAVYITFVSACFVLFVAKVVCLCWDVHDLCLIHLFRE